MVGLMDEREVSVGDRVEVGGDRGKVLYVGPVPPSHGIWLGIDWDNPSRGKHDGTHAGVAYFTPRYETSGSFVKLEKACLGQSVVAGIKDRYDGRDLILDSDIAHEIERAIKAPFLKLVGFEQVAHQQSYQSLKVVGLRGLRISDAGEAGSLSELCPCIEEMDLARNLISSWHSLADITCQTPRLSFLDLSENRLTYEDNVVPLKSAFLNLEFLVLSRMEYSWDDILHCAQMWPHILKLQVSHNKITTLRTPPPDMLKNLTLLNIEGNPISEWNEILKLGHLEKLEVLNVSYSNITEVRFPSPNNTFKSLKYILLSGNFISRWESINELNKLPSLNEVKFRDNPVLNDLTRETARQILIARIHKIQILNGQEIPSDERKGAEYDYLKQNAKSWHEAKGDETKMAAFVSLHPSYPALVKDCGEIDSSEYEPMSMALKNRLVNVVIECDGRKVPKKLPLSMSIQKLTTLLQRIFSNDCSTFFLVSAKNPALKVPLEDEMKDLSFYSVEEGDHIVIQT